MPPAKRGRPTLPDSVKKLERIIIRAPRRLKEALEHQAANDECSLSAECVKRLYKGLEADADKLAELFNTEGVNLSIANGAETKRRIIAFAMLKASIERKTRRSWLEDRYTYESMMAGLAMLWDTWAPKGEPVPPADCAQNPRDLAAPIAAGTVFNVESADDPALDTATNKYSRGLQLAPLAKPKISRRKGTQS